VILGFIYGISIARPRRCAGRAVAGQTEAGIVWGAGRAGALTLRLIADSQFGYVACVKIFLDDPSA
jgi:hypothetical protein